MESARVGMDLAALDRLFTEEGQQLLGRLDASDLSESNVLRYITQLRKDYPKDIVEAAIETVLLRVKARDKFSKASEMYFTREALEQASGEQVSSYRALRYRSYPRVADLACGIGGDAIHLAAHSNVIAVDNDPLRLLMARKNAQAYGVDARIEFKQADITEFDLPEVDAIFFDPSRRSEGRRIPSVKDYSPPLSILDRWLPTVPAVGVKISPAVRYHEITWDCEMEFISLDRELKEAVLWFGPLKSAQQRATILPSGVTMTGGDRTVSIPVTGARNYLYEPDPAVIRSHLVETLAESIGATKLDPDIAYLTSDNCAHTPFARRYQVEESMPFNLKNLNKRLRDLDVGSVIVKKRGSPIEPQELQKKLKLSGSREMIVVLTHLDGNASIILCTETNE